MDRKKTAAKILKATQAEDMGYERVPGEGYRPRRELSYHDDKMVRGWASQQKEPHPDDKMMAEPGSQPEPGTWAESVSTKRGRARRMVQL